MNNRPQTLADLHHHCTETVFTYPQVIALAKAGKLEGFGEYKMSKGWLVTNQKAALAAIKKDR